MFFRRAFAAKNQHDYGQEMFEENSSTDHQSPPSPPMKMQKRRASIEEKQSRGLSVLQLTPLWEHIIRTNSMPRSVILADVFEEFYERLHDPEWQVRQHALRVLVDVLIVMGQQADYHIHNLVHPLVDNLGHIAPAVRKGALDALRVYVAQTAMPETVMLDIMTYGMERNVKDPFGGRMTVAVMLALPALILPVLITPKRTYVVKAVMEALSNKMVKITYQEIALKILLKVKDMIGPNEFNEHMPMNVKQDFELLCKVYSLPKSPSFRDSNIDLHVPAHDQPKPWASKFVPRKDIQGNNPSAHAPMNQDASKYFGNQYDSTYPFERTRLSNNLGTPKRTKSPRSNSGGILRSSSDNNLSVDYNGNSSGSESGGSTMSFQTQSNTAANSKTVSLENGGSCGGAIVCEKTMNNGKVIMETEIKINPETAVTMRILEQNASTQTDDSDDENGGVTAGVKRLVTDFSAPYPVTPMRPKNKEDHNNNSLNPRYNYDNTLPKNGRRVRFGGEIVKMRTPDSDVVDHSDDNTSRILTIPLQKQNSIMSDESSVSSDNSGTNEYIKPTNVGFVNEPLSLNQFRSNIDHLKEKKFEDAKRKSPGSVMDPSSFSRTAPMSARPTSAKIDVIPSISIQTQTNPRPVSSRSAVVHSPPPMNIPQSETKHSSSSSATDYSQELTIGIPEVEMPAHFTPPNIMIRRTPTQTNYNQSRPSTSPMLSPRIINIQPTSSSSHSSKNNSPIKSAPTTPNLHSPCKRMKSMSPERTPIRRSVSSLSPRMIHREVTMMHNLQRSPMVSPSRTRRSSVCSADDQDRMRTGESSCDRAPYDPRFDDPHNHSRINETSLSVDLKSCEKTGSGCCSAESTPASPAVNFQPEFKSWEELGIVDYLVLKDLKSGDFRLRSRAICAIEDALKSSDNLARVQPYLDSLLRSLLTSERNPEVLEDQKRILSNLISRLPLDNLEDRVTQIVTGLCRQGGPGSNLVAKSLMQRLPTAAIVLKLLSDEFLQVRSSKFRENALQMVIFALLTFPSTYFDVANCVERTAKAALDRKKRVRQGALDVLAVLGQIGSPKTVIEVVSRLAEHRNDGLLLLAAVKARLARKQLPLVTTDGEVQYALKIPTASNVGSVIMFGSDIEYICSGSGSVSPTSVKNRSFAIQSNGIHGHESGRLFEERRIGDGMNRYAAASTGTPSKTSPWSRIPVKNSSPPASDDDHGYVVGTAIQSVQRPLESTGRFYGKLQSRSFPELSDGAKEKVPVRQLSDNQPLKNKHSKLPVASTKFPAVETDVKNNVHSISKNPYSFSPSFSSRGQRMPQSSDGVSSDSKGSLKASSSHLESRPKTHPPTIDIQQPSTDSSRSSTKHKQTVDQIGNLQRKSSGKSNGNELTIQQFTPSIGLVESDDARSEQEVIKTQPTSAKSRKSDEISNKEMVENYVEDQTRRTSGKSIKTNSHILSDTENNPNSVDSTPLHLPQNPTSSEIDHVRSEIAQIQSVIESVKKEMVQIQRQHAVSASPAHQQTSSRPQSVNSNKTFVCDEDEDELEMVPPERPKTSMDMVKEDVEMAEKMSIISRPPTSKSILKSESPFLRIATPTPDDVITDEVSSNSNYETTTTINIQFEEEIHHEDVVIDRGTDEVDDSPLQYEPMTDSMATLTTMSKENEEDDSTTIEVENVEYQRMFSPPPEEIAAMYEKTPSKVKRQPPLKRIHKVTPVKNPMPNIHQSSTVPVMMRAPKVNSTLFPHSLRRFDRPKEAIQSCLAQLDSSSWEVVMEGLKTFVRLIRHHPEYVDSQIHLMTLAISRHVKNLRSQVSRAACSAATEFFMTNAKSLDADAEELAASLLNRTADTNKFLRADALKALESMCDALHPSKVILILTFRGANHQNAAVRCTTARLLNLLVFRIGCDKVYNMHKDIRDRLILTGANLLMEGSLETRNHTKELFKQLSIHSHYQKLLLDVIPPNVYRNIEKSLKSIQ